MKKTIKTPKTEHKDEKVLWHGEFEEIDLHPEIIKYLHKKNWFEKRSLAFRYSYYFFGGIGIGLMIYHFLIK